MAELLINPATKKVLDAYLHQPSHAVILTGRHGVGLGTIAADIATELAGTAQAVTTLSPEKNLISIDSVRGLYATTRSTRRDRQVIVIDDADSMSSEAQNALLKLLEEPVQNVHFILTTHKPSKLLPTISSRAQYIDVLPIGREASDSLIARFKLEATKASQVTFLASGLPAEIVRLTSDQDYFEKRIALVTGARRFLQGSAYERLVVLQTYTARDHALQFLSECSRLLMFSVLKQRQLSAADSMSVLDTVMTRIENGGHVRTQLMYLVTKFS